MGSVEETEISVQEEDPLNTLWSQVFRIPLLLEKILGYVIHHKEKVLSTEVCSARLVSKEWSSATNTLLRVQAPKAVFKIPLTHENSTSGTAYVQQHGKVLDQFSSSSMLLHEGKRVPLFSFNASPDFFQHKDNHQELLDCLTQNGGNVVELQLTLEIYHNLKPLNPGTRLTNLRSLSMGTTHFNFFVPLRDFAASVFGASPQLTAINLSSFNSVNLNRIKYIPWSTAGMENFVLPSSITDISLSAPFDRVQELFNHPLPNLKRLRLQTTVCDIKSDLLFTLLESVRETVEEFTLEGDDGFTYSVHLRIPLMTKLQVLRVDVAGIRLDKDHSSLQLLLPSLKHLTLYRTLMLDDFTKSSRFDSVTSLTASCFYPNMSYNIFINLRSQFRAFPNVVKLEITVDDTIATRLKYVWGTLVGVEKLKIYFCCHFPQFCKESSWDEFLIGYSVAQIDALEKNTHLGNRLEQTRRPSITALTVLETLHLETAEKYNISLISDATFKLAFLKMPKLSKLILSSDFSASSEMKQVWEGEKSTIGIQRKLIANADT